MINPSTIDGWTTFEAPHGVRLSTGTRYFLALVSTGRDVQCATAARDMYVEGSASDWWARGGRGLNSSGRDDGRNYANGCAMTIKGEAAIGTSYIANFRITSTPANGAIGYLTGETLKVSATMSEAVTVDTTTPPTVTVDIGGTTRTMTYDATGSTGTELKFEYTIVAADVDGTGVSFGENPLTGTITRTSDSKAADLNYRALADDPDQNVNSAPEVTVEFREDTYSVEEGSSVTLTVTLSADPKRTVVIPITATAQGGATIPADYTAPATSVTFNSGQTSRTLTLSTTEDTTADTGKGVLFAISSTLPDKVVLGTNSSTTVTILDDDPPVTIDFEEATYEVVEGESVAVKVVLSEAPQREVRAQFSFTYLGSADELDIDAVTGVIFDTDETEKVIGIRAIPDITPDHGESVRLSFDTFTPGVTASGTTTTTVTIIDDDPAVEVEFGETAYSVEEGTSVDVTVTLSEDPQRPLSIPITAMAQGGATAPGGTETADYTVPDSVTFARGQTSRTVRLSVTEDTIADDGESIQLTFGTLPPGVTEGTDNETTVTIVDDDPAVTVDFDAATYSVVENDRVLVKVVLSAAPQRNLRIPLTITPLGGASAADYDFPATVNIESDDTELEFSFAAEPDTTPDHGESVRLSFGTMPPGVTASGTTTTTVTIIDDDPPVTVEFGETAYSVEEGASVDVTVTLSEEPKRPLTIPITATAQGTTTAPGSTGADYSAPASSVTFASRETSKTVRLSVTEDMIADDGESVRFSFGSDLPPGVSEGTDNETTVTIIDDDPAVTISFGAATYSADEGGSVDVTLTLSEDPQRTVIIPITATNLTMATSADYSVSTSVTFNSGDTSKTISFSATDDTIDDDDETVRLSFGTLPPGVTSSGTTTTTVSINDDDDPEITVQFASAAYTVVERNNGSVTVTVTLNNDPERTVTIPLSYAYAGPSWGRTSFRTTPASVTFDSGEQSQTFTVTVNDDFHDNDPTTATVSFGTLPDRVSEGATDETVISVTDDETRGIEMTANSATVVEGGTTTYTIRMKSEPTADVTITVNAPTDSSEASASPSSITLTGANWVAGETITITVTDDDEDESTETATFTHTLSGGDYGANNVTVSNFVVSIEDDDETPVITGSADISYPEHEYDDDSPDLTVATYSATDGDGDDVTWSVGGYSQGTHFTHQRRTTTWSWGPEHSTSAGLTSRISRMFEAHHWGTIPMSLEVQASDGTNTARFATSTVTVTNVNETARNERRRQ